MILSAAPAKRSARARAADDHSDHIAYVGNDMLAIRKAIREMLRRGIDRHGIRKAVFDNANTFYGLGLEP